MGSESDKLSIMHDDVLYIGWDVGAWHCQSGKSRDALCALPGKEPWRGNLARHSRWNTSPLDALRECLGLEAFAASTVLAIDAPLGWPTAFRGLLVGDQTVSVDAGRGKRHNQYLLRETERRLWRNKTNNLAKLNPLSAVQDMIGSQSSKVLHLLRREGFEAPNESRPGIWVLEQRDCVIEAIETYPSVLRGFEPFGPAPESKTPRGANQDHEDARLCARLAREFHENRSLLMEPDSSDLKEGWIWAPKSAYRIARNQENG